jgi:hypothetical protein
MLLLDEEVRVGTWQLPPARHKNTYVAASTDGIDEDTDTLDARCCYLTGKSC